MDKKKQVYNPEEMARRPLGLTLDNTPALDPEWRTQSIQQMRKSTFDFEGTVKRLIAHLEEK
jgi:hypothetical protein